MGNNKKTCAMLFLKVSVSESDPDPNRIRIQSGQWIRIHIRNPETDPEGQKLPTKGDKNQEI